MWVRGRASVRVVVDVGEGYCECQSGGRCG